MRTSLLLAALLAPLAASAEPVKVVTLTPRVQRQVEKDLATMAGELIVDALGRGKGMHALGAADVVPFLDETAQSQLEACDDDTACLIDIGGALGVDYVVAPSIGALGESWIITLRFLVPMNGSVAHRATTELPRDEGGLMSTLCPFVQKSLVELAQKDPRVSGDPSRCGDGEAPVAEVAPVQEEETKETRPEPRPEPVKKPAVAPKDGLAFGVRGGLGAHVGVLGVGLEVRTGRLAFGLGTGSYTLTASVTAELTRFSFGTASVSPYASAHVAWTGAKSLFGFEQKAGPAGGATVGLELRPVRFLSLRGGVGAAYNPQTWGTADHGPLAFDASLGLVF